MSRIALTGLLVFLASWLIAHIPSVHPLPENPLEEQWVPPDTQTIGFSPEASLIRYGRDLIAHTSRYFGPKGRLGHDANGMNCQNCHLDAGARPWGNNFSAVFSTYPRYRERRGSVETICERVNDCFQRSLNGRPLDTAGPEMQAMIAYMKWLGNKVPKGSKPPGSGIGALAFMSRAADPARGRSVYARRCVSCHGPEGEGRVTDSAGTTAATGTYLYPPLWGAHSYNTAAGLYRLSRFAGFIRDNMPFGSTHRSPGLTEEEAWDVAAFVNSQPRPDTQFPMDWPDIRLKPIDHPFGPYSDPFSENLHKYGPFDSILAARGARTK
ncbi:MAG: c-type cytochrome [Bacteroidota bacterium]|nr:c-type cytochrome [Bacteroidota bacterium]MDP4246611.1 c-type cytochrome [Bacteroidota bacterium]MDP4257164.1 c-type cytochrome [Bacteroidota bacterium]